MQANERKQANAITRMQASECLQANACKQATASEQADANQKADASKGMQSNVRRQVDESTRILAKQLRPSDCYQATATKRLQPSGTIKRILASAYKQPNESKIMQTR